jgi:hypothetical protein
MADDIDRANDYAEAMREAALKTVSADITEGKPGECDWCGEYTPRLVNNACARCRDYIGLE